MIANVIAVVSVYMTPKICVMSIMFTTQGSEHTEEHHGSLHAIEPLRRHDRLGQKIVEAAIRP